MQPYAVAPADLREWDEVLITGTASSPHGLHVAGLRGTVATHSPGDRTLKVWPTDEKDPQFAGLSDYDRGDCGKLWFEWAGIQEVILTGRENPETGEWNPDPWEKTEAPL